MVKEHTRAEFVQFSRKDLEELATMAARLRLVGNLYCGSIGPQHVVWTEAGGIDVITHHTPSSLSDRTAEKQPRAKKEVDEDRLGHDPDRVDHSREANLQK